MGKTWEEVVKDRYQLLKTIGASRLPDLSEEEIEASLDELRKVKENGMSVIDKMQKYRRLFRTEEDLLMPEWPEQWFSAAIDELNELIRKNKEAEALRERNESGENESTENETEAKKD